MIISNDERVKNYFAFYRKRRSENFSDSEIVYEIPLTEQLFDQQMELLSTKKLQSQFENFIIATAERLITPNIKPQTGPDGGGDGKIDAETYEVSDDVSSRWYVGADAAVGKEQWAIAVSCKRQWKSKVESDVAKIIGTGRGYSKVLFFSNQYIKASARIEVEQELSSRYKIPVSIFDRLWCQHAVFQHGCMDIALKELAFSDEYKKKHVSVGPNDKRRQERLDALEKAIVRPVDGLDTGYVDELHETFILSRNLERPRTETEGRYYRAISQCDLHGTEQQRFNLIYDHAWSSFFWFEDVKAAYKDYLQLKEFIEKDCTVARLEKLTNLKTVLVSAETMGIVSIPGICDEVDYIQQLEKRLAQDPKRRASHLFLRLHIAEQDLIYRARQKESLTAELEELKSMLLEAASCLDISFESQYEVMNILAESIGDNSEFDKILDEVSEKLSANRQAICAARIRLDRAQAYLEKSRWKEAVRHLSFCVYAFEREECTDELIRSSGQMGLALWEMGLPYSAEAFLIKSASFLFKDYYKSGIIPHLLVTVLQRLCEIELMLGRLVMYLNWNALLMAVSRDRQFFSTPDFSESVKMQDASWACRFAAADLAMPVFAMLPDILDRAGMFVSSEFLKFTLGYPGDLDEQTREVSKMRDWRKWMIEQPVFEQFLCELNISMCGSAHLETTVNNFSFKVDYPNLCDVQRIVEVLLASVEAMMATADMFEFIPYHSEIHIQVVMVDGKSKMRELERKDQYELEINLSTFTDEAFWESVVYFVACFFARNAVTRTDVKTLLVQKQEQERLFDRVSVLQHTRMAFNIIFGDRFKHCVEDWKASTDKVYAFQGDAFDPPHKTYSNHRQLTVAAFRVNEDMDVWEGAGWKACFFLAAAAHPPWLGLVFENPERADRIVTEWRDLAAAGKPCVKIFIVRGIDATHPAWYRVCVAPDGVLDERRPGKMILSVCRKLTMTPETTKNLDFFERQYGQYGCCRLVSCCFKDMSAAKMPKLCSPGFIFSKVVIMNAYEICDGSEAVFALEVNDNPVIPEDRKDNVPVLAVMKKLRSNQGRR